MTLVTTPFDSADYLTSDIAIEAYLEDALESGEAHVIAHALGVVARAKGMGHLAQQSGLSSETSNEASSEGDPGLGTILKMVQALGLRLSIAHSDAERGRPAA